eukprot:6206606-Pleurochrysis_carterae.AAC.1
MTHVSDRASVEVPGAALPPAHDGELKIQPNYYYENVTQIEGRVVLVRRLFLAAELECGTGIYSCKIAEGKRGRNPAVESSRSPPCEGTGTVTNGSRLLSDLRAADGMPVSSIYTYTTNSLIRWRSSQSRLSG